MRPVMIPVFACWAPMLTVATSGDWLKKLRRTNAKSAQPKGDSAGGVVGIAAMNGLKIAPMTRVATLAMKPRGPEGATVVCGDSACLVVVDCWALAPLWVTDDLDALSAEVELAAVSADRTVAGVDDRVVSTTT